MNWRGRPLTSHEVIVNSIAATTTGTGLTVRAELDPGSYPTGTEISDAQMAAVPLARHRFHGDWNYTIHPHLTPPPPATSAAEPSRIAAGSPDRVTLPYNSHKHIRMTKLTCRTAGNPARAEPAPAARHRAPPRGRSRPARQAHQRRPDPGHRALPAQTLHPSSSWRTVRRGRSRITEATREIRPLLEEHGHAITPATARFPAPADLITFLAAEDAEPTAQIKPAC